MTFEERFWAKVDKTGDCWLWMGFRNQKGYGRVNVTARQPRGAHRVAWELIWEPTNGPIPAGMSVCHACHNPPCVNPDHLYLATNAQNHRDSALRHRSNFYERHPMAKLTRSDVDTIRTLKAEGVTQADLARRYGVAPSCISKIVNFKAWVGHDAIPPTERRYPPCPRPELQHH